jgi:hypothetical protein
MAASKVEIEVWTGFKCIRNWNDPESWWAAAVSEADVSSRTNVKN